MEKNKTPSLNMFPERISKDEINELPLANYTGEIELIDKPILRDAAIAQLLDQDVIAFDTESRPAFRKGQYYPVSLLQVAIPDKVILFRIGMIGNLSGLAKVFENEKIAKVGISIRDDVKELQKVIPFNPQNVIEINNLAKEVGVQAEGVRNLSAIFLGYRISKSQQTTNWDREELTEKQLRYAATDAWVCWEIYHMLDRKGFIY
jgi:ribonuclease D